MLKLFINMAVFLYKVTNGAVGGSMLGLPVLLLTSTGRKSGQSRTVPLGFLKDGATYVVIASNGGNPRHPAWFFNLQSNPEATIQVKNTQLKVRAEQANLEQRRQLWARLVEASPNYAKYQQRANREIPVMILSPLA